MGTKISITQKKMASLGLMKNEKGDYEYIDPLDKNKSKYRIVKKEPK